MPRTNKSVNIVYTRVPITPVRKACERASCPVHVITAMWGH